MHTTMFLEILSSKELFKEILFSNALTHVNENSTLHHIYLHIFVMTTVLDQVSSLLKRFSGALKKFWLFEL